MTDNNEEKLETVVYKPTVKEKKSISFVWILPLIVLSILGWVVYESYSKKGTNISVIFKSAEGLKEGVTPLEYRGLQLGKVTKIAINDLNSVKVNILVNSDVAKYVASEGASFWIKKPTVSLTKISGLGTILSGNKIEISPKYRNIKELEKVNPKYDFIGLDSKPDFDLDEKGYYVSILSSRADLVETETPIFFNKFQIGEIVSKEFRDESVYLKAYIYDKYNDLVNDSSSFVMNKALKVNFGASGMSLEVSSLYSALVGGITVQTPKKDAPKMSKDKYYVLYEDENDLLKKIFFNIKFSTAKGIGKDTVIMYKGIEVGKVEELHLGSDDVIVKAYLFENYKYLLTKNSKFYLEEAEIGLDGIKNLGTVVRGNYLSIDYKKGEESFFFEIEEKDSKKSFSSDVIVTLFSENLNSISNKSKIYFKNIEIGKVLDYTLTKDYKKVKIRAIIKRKYKKLINDKTLFYDMSSKLVELKDLDLNINNIGFKPLLDGAISLVDIKRNEKYTKKSFKLYSSYKDVEELKRVQTEGSFISAYFDNSFEIKENQSINYKNQEIGFVKSIKFDDKKSKVKMFIYSKYKKYITKKSRFYKKGVLKLDASLSGVLFELDNFSSLLNGSIKLDNSSNKSYKNYQIFSSKDSMQNSSNTIKIYFDDVEGLKTEFSKLTYKGVDVGKVTNISLNSKNKVLVKVQIFKDFEKFAKQGTTFYLKKPKLSLNQIENVGSTIMPINIGVQISKQRKVKTTFNGYDNLENVKKAEDGVILKVVSLHPSSVSEDAPIYYKNVQIGKVNKIGLSFDGSKVLLDCLIYNRYKHFVRTDSTFHDISGFKLKFSIFSGTEIKTNTFTSIIKGGLLVVTPYKYHNIATSKDTFILKEDLMEDWEKISPSIKIRD
ncbi:MlaD family protein [Arcobacter sp. LA11]|uniref:MlaD family protein n=1 Tax=Arcobacter sp. LA11 TaxID=1898176 RepID=UPI00093460AB|nr:MlaD family protein [Arcobacter sp. LA11]